MKSVAIQLRRRPEFLSVLGFSRQFDQGSDYHWFRARITGSICNALDIDWDCRAWDLVPPGGPTRGEEIL